MSISQYEWASCWGCVMEISSFHAELDGSSSDQHRHVGLSSQAGGAVGAAGLWQPFSQTPASGQAAGGTAMLSILRWSQSGVLHGAEKALLSCPSFTSTLKCWYHSSSTALQRASRLPTT